MAGSTELRWGGASDVGRVRSNNQDSYLARGEVGLWVVADGMGGHRGGEVASEIACETISNSFMRHTVEGLIEAIENANGAVYDAGSGDPDLAGMGTTIVALALVDDDQGDQVLAIANVGDSRAYRLADGELDQLTNDHSLVADLVREGSLSPDEAAVHPQRNILTRVLGVYDDVPVDVVTVLPQHGDRYVLCSDGLFNEVPEPAIAAVLRRLGDPAEVAKELVRLANEGGGRDNVTVVVVDVVDDDGRSQAASAALASEPSTASYAAFPALDDEDELASPGGRRRGAGRSRSGDDGSPQHRAPRARRVTWRVVLFFVLLLALAGGALATINWYGRSTYFVSFDGDHVAIFKGRPGGVLWLDPELVETSDLARDRVPADTVGELADGKEQGSLAEAEAYVDNLLDRSDALRGTTTTTTSRPSTSTTRQGQATTTTQR